MKLFKLPLFGLMIMASLNCLKAQSNLTNDYIVISTSNVESSTPYTAALDAANWEDYRLQNQRLQLAFDNGFTLELKSAMEMVNLGYPLNISSYRMDNPAGYVAPVLHL